MKILPIKSLKLCEHAEEQLVQSEVWDIHGPLDIHCNDKTDQYICVFIFMEQIPDEVLTNQIK